ncbi:Retrovirus-related Pol polyprotein from transposon 297 [Araneus ventricosus]|uniref:Retrovirus-related Pol polyprotein from transposon 297 n=1 Tax=Araneus ventricosus TaxID=182803 RepID=A0A4Y2EYV7_ARAVE|nr:Retrovirus-related Pol polyprotein from transposon 297 [Araneus ventricosus]
MLVDTGANVTLLRTDLAQELKEKFIYTAPNISLKTATGEKAEINGKLDAIECVSRKFQHRIYVDDITDPCILGLDFLQRFNFTVDIEKNEILTGVEEIPLFSASAEHAKLCSVLAKEKTVIPARSECLIQGVPEVSEQFRYALTDSPNQVSQKGVLVAATLVDLKMEAVHVLNLDNKPKIADKGTVIASCEPVVDIVARLQEFSESQHLPSILENLKGLNEEQQFIDDTLDALNGSQWFSTLDLKSGYWQVEIRPEDREKTAFASGQGLWQFKVMPFGLCNAPATFERLMETVLRGLTSEACLVYLDGIIIVGRTFEEHLNNIRKVFQRLQKPNLKLSPKKCRFFRKEHRKGTSHGNADALSRRPCKESCKHCAIAEKKFRIETDIFVKVLTTNDPWSSNEVQKAQLEDPAISPILEKKLNPEDRPESPATKRYWALWDSLHLKDGVLYDGSSWRWQLILQQNSRSSARDS